MDTTNNAPDTFELSDVIANLRQNLEHAKQQGSGEDLQFLLDDIELEFQVVITKEGGGKFNIKFWVLNAAADGKYTNAVTQKIKMKFKVKDNTSGEPLAVSRLGKR